MANKQKTNWTKLNFILSVVVLVVSTTISIISLCKSNNANEQSQNATNIASEANSGTIINAEKLDSVVIEQNNIKSEVNTIKNTMEVYNVHVDGSKNPLQIGKNNKQTNNFE